MKVLDIIREGVTFHACTLEDDEKHGKVVTPHGWRREKQKCFVCKGAGEEEWNNEKHKCGLCNGDGHTDEWVSDSPELQVSNSNASAIVTDLLKQKFDYAGVVHTEDLPELRRRLIKMKNSEKDRSKLHKSPHSNKEERQMGKNSSAGNVTKIGYNQPHMIDGGRTPEQVMRYVDRLLHMVEYAMKHNLVLSWA